MFQNYLKKIRLTTFSTQEEFCRKADIPLGTFKNWELGRQLPNTNSWKKLYSFVLSSKADTKLIEKLRECYLDEKV